jgi:hypothetical protein
MPKKTIKMNKIELGTKMPLTFVVDMDEIERKIFKFANFILFLKKCYDFVLFSVH